MRKTLLVALMALASSAAHAQTTDSTTAAPVTPPPAAPAPTPAEPAPPTQSLAELIAADTSLSIFKQALEKANLIVKDHPGTKEAELVSTNLNELRWKAEPKYVAPHAPITADQEKQLREKGLAAMYNHVKTYMDLEMWELARQKAVAILKSFPDSPEAIELMKVYDTIEKKARESVGTEVKAAES